MVRCLLLALGLGLGLGCSYTVQMHAEPVPAMVTLPDGSSVLTPAEVPVRIKPFAPKQVTVRAPGYRPLELDLRRREVTLWNWWTDLLFHPAAVIGAEPRSEVVFLLVEEHEPVK